ncbi:hypothetical protein ACP2AV_06360 [Aliiroseovarius sp. PTFE2010]|uniref:hypothetical protein n=1 Tax=Aliiroseovarius sp. PTFE2010 TaxID=3417190 RepID=UPI003CF57867
MAELAYGLDGASLLPAHEMPTWVSGELHMPLDKFVLMLIVVIAAAGVTVWIGWLVLASIAVPFGWVAVIPVSLIGFVLYRVLVDRLSNAEDDHYDKVEK